MRSIEEAVDEPAPARNSDAPEGQVETARVPIITQRPASDPMDPSDVSPVEAPPVPPAPPPPPTTSPPDDATPEQEPVPTRSGSRWPKILLITGAVLMLLSGMAIVG